MSRHLDGQAVVQEGLGGTDVEQIEWLGDGDVFHVAATREIEVDIGRQGGQNLEIVVELHEEGGILGGDKTDG